MNLKELADSNKYSDRMVEIFRQGQIFRFSDIRFTPSTHIETVVLLGNQKTKPDSYIKLSVDMDEFNKVKNGEK